MEKKFFKRAIELARNGAGFTSPNPCVGAIVVKNGRIIGEGWHKKAGSDHAEIVAIKSVRKSRNLVGLDLYVTLEPCVHYGRTPPCAEAIVAVGIKRVFVGMEDPFKLVNGKGVNFLRKNGVRVELLKRSEKLHSEVRELNQSFLKWVKTGLPYVTLKAGVSLDGRMATVGGESQWLTDVLARNDGKIERSKCDAVVVGAGTVKIDNPDLGTVGKFSKKKLLRIVIDKDLTTKLNSKVYRDGNVLMACSDLAKKSLIKKFRTKGVEVYSFGKNRVSIKSLLKFLGKRGIQSVFVEGGSGIHGAFYDAFLKNARLVDRILFYFSPKIIGGKNSLPMIGGEGAKKLASVIELKSIKIDKLGKDFKLQGVYNLY